MREWGRLPQEVIGELQRIEWDHPVRLRERLAGARRFPIKQSLKPPTGSQAIEDVGHFHDYVAAWRRWPKPHQVIWKSRQFRQLGDCDVPVRLEIESVQALIEVLGKPAIDRSMGWTARIEPLLALEKGLYPTLIKQLLELEKLPVGGTKLLAHVLPQLHRGMGEGRYLRALPLLGVDTKFLEVNQSLVVALLDGLHGQEVSSSGGLEQWLGCIPTPSNWLYVRPLCPKVRGHLAGFDLLRLPLEQLLEHPLPGERVLVVENLQSGFGLPDLPDTVAVFGGGRNTAWLQAQWLAEKRIGYWGDLDTWGLKFLADTRSMQPHVEALMMEKATVLAHIERGVNEEAPATLPERGLTGDEAALFQDLRSGVFGIGRLEQERLSQDYVVEALHRWLERCR